MNGWAIFRSYDAGVQNCDAGFGRRDFPKRRGFFFQGEANEYRHEPDHGNMAFSAFVSNYSRRIDSDFKQRFSWPMTLPWCAPFIALLAQTPPTWFIFPSSTQVQSRMSILFMSQLSINMSQNGIETYWLNNQS
jgi:hypothetical protein